MFVSSIFLNIFLFTSFQQRGYIDNFAPGRVLLAHSHTPKGSSLSPLLSTFLKCYLGTRVHIFSSKITWTNPLELRKNHKIEDIWQLLFDISAHVLLSESLSSLQGLKMLNIVKLLVSNNISYSILCKSWYSIMEVITNSASANQIIQTNSTEVNGLL